MHCCLVKMHWTSRYPQSIFRLGNHRSDDTSLQPTNLDCIAVYCIEFLRRRLQWVCGLPLPEPHQVQRTSYLQLHDFYRNCDCVESWICYQSNLFIVVIFTVQWKLKILLSTLTSRVILKKGKLCFYFVSSWHIGMYQAVEILPKGKQYPTNVGHDNMSIIRQYYNPIIPDWSMNVSVNYANNCLLPFWRQTIIWTNAVLLSIAPMGTDFSEIGIQNQQFSYKKIYLKTILSILSQHQCIIKWSQS